MIVEIIQTDFAPGDDFPMLGKTDEFVEMRLGDFFGFVRVNAYAGVDPVVLLGVWNCGVELLRARTGPDSEQRIDPGVAGALQHSFAIISKLRKINVRVR